jgi:hypothetical protein
MQAGALRKTQRVFVQITNKLRFSVAIVSFGFAILVTSGCQRPREGEELVRLEGDAPQFQRSVPVTPQGFNGTTCTICIDVTGLGDNAQLAWTWQAGQPIPPQLSTPGGAADAIGDVLAADITRQIAATCPAGVVKLQFLYHCDPKMIRQVENNTIRQVNKWVQKDSVIRALQALNQNNRNQIGKVYLQSCYSFQQSPSVVNAAFQLPKVTRVLTVNETIELDCHYINAVTYDEDFRPDLDFKVIVWNKDQQGRQIADVPTQKIDAAKRFDTQSNTVVQDP